MHAIDALLDELIDYAGLFPPARLDMDPAVRTYARHRQGPLASALGRFIVPIARIEEFEVAAASLLPVVPGIEDEAQAPELWGVSALVSAAEDLDSVRADLETIEAFNDRHTEVGAGAAIIDTIELKAGSGEAVDAVLDLLEDEIYPYFELDHRTALRGTVAAIAGLDGGAKIRTGGLDPAAHPSVDELAGFIEACSMAGVPFKATAGLHHPVRAHQSSVDTMQFGFLNVFLGASMLHADRIDVDRLRDLLGEEDPKAFLCTDRDVSWRGVSIDAESLAAARSRFAHSYGSCSFDEPTDELREMGWPVPAMENRA